ILSDDEPAFFTDRLEPDTAVGARPREDDADRALAVAVRQRTQEEIEGQARAVRRLRLRKPQHAFAHRQIGLRRNHINAVAFQRHAVAAYATFIVVSRPSRSTIMLSWVGSRCEIRTKAIPVSAGN